MKKMLGALLVIALPVWAGDAPSGCGSLCGNWALDAAHGDAVETVIDAALETYKEPSPYRPRKPRRDDPPEEAGFDLNAPLPGFGPQSKEQMRTTLLADLTPQPTLVLSADGDEVLIHSAAGLERRVFPGEPHSRVDSQGTAKIRSDWKKDALVIKESYGSKRSQTETYAPQPDGTLLVTRVVDRAGVKTMHLRFVYRRGSSTG